MAQLIMLPVPVSDGEMNSQLPESVVGEARRLKYFLAENAKSARAFLKLAGHPAAISELSIKEIGHRPDPKQLSEWLAPLKEGHDVGVLSEAGCPGIADPGAQLAKRAMELNYRVKPLVGPCSIILALMASGLDGQHFRFCGYLPQKEPERSAAIRNLEKRSGFEEGETQLFIETPYRNNAMLADLVKATGPETRILVASDITGSREFIRTQTAKEWKNNPVELPKLPTIFGLLAPCGTSKNTDKPRRR